MKPHTTTRKQHRSSQRGGMCGATCPMMQGGYYRPTARNRYVLKKYKQGKSIGFTMRSSLKAKGLIPRANGTYRVSAKYQSRIENERRRSK